MILFYYLFCIYFRVGAYGMYQMAFEVKYNNFKFLLPPTWWKLLMCKFKKHDWDLCYAGPDASKIQCMDCGWCSETSRNKKTGLLETKEYYGL
jgi:hypothetical protein